MNKCECGKDLELIDSKVYFCFPCRKLIIHTHVNMKSSIDELLEFNYTKEQIIEKMQMNAPKNKKLKKIF